MGEKDQLRQEARALQDPHRLSEEDAQVRQCQSLQGNGRDVEEAGPRLSEDEV